MILAQPGDVFILDGSITTGFTIDNAPGTAGAVPITVMIAQTDTTNLALQEIDIIFAMGIDATVNVAANVDAAKFALNAVLAENLVVNLDPGAQIGASNGPDLGLEPTPPTSTTNGPVDGTDAGQFMDSNFTDAQGNSITQGDDTIFGFGGNDNIRGEGGDDVILGGTGNDFVGAGSGNDTIFGEAGNDNLRGDAGDDLILGGSGDDFMDGGEGHDTLRGGTGNDDLRGGAGDDLLFGGSDDDYLSGDAGDDTLLGGDGADLIDGGFGDDVIDGGDGDDFIRADPSASATIPNLIVNGSFEDATGMTETFFGFTATGGIRGWTTSGAVDGIEIHNDERDGIIATDGQNWLDMEATPGNLRIGQDVQNLADGETYALSFDVSDSQFLTSLDGPDENVLDVFFGGQLIATIDPSNVGESDFQTVTLNLVAGSGDGTDRLEFQGRGVEDNLGVSLDNVILLPTTQAGIDAALAGNDIIDGGAGNDTILAGGGDDIIDGGLGNDSIAGGAGNDTIHGDDSGVGGGTRSFSYSNDFDGADPLLGATIPLQTGGSPGVTNVANNGAEPDSDNEFVFVQGFLEDQTAVLAVSPNLATGESVTDFSIAFTLDMASPGGSDWVDGLSVNFGDLGTIPPELENGVSEGLAVRLDPLANVAQIIWNGTVIASETINDLETRVAGTFSMEVSADGVVSVTLPTETSPSLTATIPAGEWDSADQTGWQFGLAGRTGDNEGFIYVDDLQINANIDGTPFVPGAGGDDFIDGGAGDDIIFGEGGDDTISGGGGNDTITGGEGNDLIHGDAFGADIISSEDFSSAPSGWTDPSGTTPATANESLSGDPFLGRFAGNADGSEQIRKTFDLTDTADYAVIEFDFLKIDSWDDNDGESFTIYIDGAAAFTYIPAGSGTSSTGADASGSFAGGTWSVKSSGADSELGFSNTSAAFEDRVYQVRIVLDNPGDTVTLGVGAQLGQALEDESWGIDDVNVASTNDPNFDFSAPPVTGDDILDGGDGNDTIFGGDGNDIIQGGAGDDIIHGDGGADTLTGGLGDDSIFGGDGDDVIILGGSDQGFGGLGDDVFIVDPADPLNSLAPIYVDGGSDATTGDPGGLENGNSGDHLDLSNQTNDLTVAFATNPESGEVSGLDADDADGADLIFDEIELVSTGSGDDLIDGAAATGGISVFANGGADTLIGGAGDDLLEGGAGADVLIGGAGDDILLGGDGDDRIAVGGQDLAFGDAGDDVFTIDASDPLDGAVAAFIDGGSDATSGEPAGTQNGDAGDLLDMADQTANLTIVFGADGKSGTVDGFDADNADGGDLIFVEIERIDSGEGADVIDGSAAISGIIVDAGGGDDTLIGGAGDDLLTGGTGNDTFVYSGGNDTITDFNTGNTGTLDDGDPTNNDSIDLSTPCPSCAPTSWTTAS